MAKKTEKKSEPTKAAKKTEEKPTLVKAKDAVVKGAEKVAGTVTAAAVAVKDHVVHPVAEAVGLAKPKRKRFVREKKEKKEPVKAAPLARSTKPDAKLMTKNVVAAPKDEVLKPKRPKP